MRNRVIPLLSAVILAGSFLTGCIEGQGGKNKEVSMDEIQKGGFMVAVSCHDPQVVEDNGTYYMFGSHMVAAKSKDLRQWSYVATGVDAANPLFDNLLTDNFAAFSFVGKNTDGGYSVWASNVFYNHAMEKYMMYFSTTSSYIKSNICFAVADSVEGPYTYADTILYSGYGKSDAERTNLYEILGAEGDISRYLKYGGYDNEKWPNCIDPAIFTDENGRIWMVYGSWSGGIFLLEMDPHTGYPVYPAGDEENQVDSYYGKRLIGGGHHSIEGPYIEYDADSGYYYLFVSYGELKRDGGYQIRQFRSEKPDGPYVDVAGKTLEDQDDHFNYGLKMIGNYTFPSLNYTYMAPGGQSTFQGKDGKYYITYHQRFDNGTEYFEPRVHQMFLNKKGWFVAAPFATMGEGEKKEGYKQSDVQGMFYLVNHGTDISSRVREAEAVTIEKDGSFTGEEGSGSCKVEGGTSFIHLTLNDMEYDGILLEMEDEAGNPVLCFTAAGASNESIWGVQYLAKK